MLTIEWLDFFILILATFRLTHLIVFDEITSFIRKPFLTATIQENASGQLEEIIEIKGSGLRHFIGSLLSCYWCVGFWCSVITVLIYYYLPAAFPLLLLFAVAGAAALISARAYAYAKSLRLKTESRFTISFMASTDCHFISF